MFATEQNESCYFEIRVDGHGQYLPQIINQCSVLFFWGNRIKLNTFKTEKMTLVYESVTSSLQWLFDSYLSLRYIAL